MQKKMKHAIKEEKWGKRKRDENGNEKKEMKKEKGEEEGRE